MSKSKIIAGFPGVGKSNVNETSKLSTCDSDSSMFSWLDKDHTIRNPNFIVDYINEIKARCKEYDFVFISTHKDILIELSKVNLDNLYIVLPERGLKDEYIQRYKNRGSSESFINNINKNWDVFINDIESISNAKLIYLKSGQYFIDAVELIMKDEVI